MASAAALELRPFCPAERLGAKELCWITGAGDPVGSEVSFMLSSAATQKKRQHKYRLKPKLAKASLLTLNTL